MSAASPQKGRRAVAAILVVEEDQVLATQMMRTLRQAGHHPVLASHAQAALREAEGQPDMILLDLELVDGQGEEFLSHLQARPETATIPVLAITCQRETGFRLREQGLIAALLRKPLSGVHLRKAIEHLTAGQEHGEAETEVERQLALVLRLIFEGPDPLVMGISRCLTADRCGAHDSADAPTWGEIAEWGRRAGLLDSGEARLLCGLSPKPVLRDREMLA